MPAVIGYAIAGYQSYILFVCLLFVNLLLLLRASLVNKQLNLPLFLPINIDKSIITFLSRFQILQAKLKQKLVFVFKDFNEFNSNSLASLVGKAPVYFAGGLSSVPSRTNTRGSRCCLCANISKWLDFHFSRIRTLNRRPSPSTLYRGT